MAHGGGYANNNFDMIMNSSLSSINSPLLRALITPASLLNPDTNDLLYSSENSIITNHYDSGDSGGGGGVGIGGDYMTGSRSDAKIICSNADLIAFKLKDPSAVVAVIFLVIINLAVIAGNILVIVSVFVSTKLRTVTNFFIVSLAVADLLLGLTVVPYSLCLAVLDVWIFGEIWCLGWLVIDVWLSTASILNLCAISVDRYLAVTRPVRYRSIMTSKRAKLIIAFVWILSFIVSFPPILTWSQSGSILSKSGTGGGLSSIASFKTPEEPSIASTMNFGDVNSIVTAASTASSYTSSSPSSSSSSYTPNLSSMEISRNPYESSNLQNLMSDILSDENNISNGNNNNNDNNNNNNNNNSNDSNRYMVNGDLPQSRGSSSSSSSSLPLPPTSPSPDCRWNAYQCVLFSSTGYVTYSALGSFYIPMSFMMFFYWRIYTVASRATRALKRGYKTTGRSRNENSSGGYSDERLTLRIHRGYICEGVGPNRGSNLHPLVSPMAGGSSPNHSPNLLSSSAATDCNTSFITNSSRNQSNDTSPKRIRSLLKIKRSDHRGNETGCESSINKLSDKENKKINKKLRRKKPITVYKLSSSPVAENGERLKRLSDDGSSSSPYNRDSNKSNSSKSVRFSRRTNTTGRWQTKRLLAETKAAKTVGIIVGGFIICWFPFFTIYLIRGYCQDQKCIPTLMLTIFTWLGYANSAVNPIIYGMFSRDFRRAFQNILCKCKYSEETGVTSLIRQIHLPNLFEDDNHDEMKTDSQEDIQ